MDIIDKLKTEIPYDEKCCECITDKTARIRTYVSYRESVEVQRGITVYGGPDATLFYNYSDRLDYDKWQAAEKHARELGLDRNTAAYYDAALSYYHDQPVDVRHIVAGCNLSNGYPWLCFGYVLEIQDA